MTKISESQQKTGSYENQIKHALGLDSYASRKQLLSMAEKHLMMKRLKKYIRGLIKIVKLPANIYTVLQKKLFKKDHSV